MSNEGIIQIDATGRSLGRVASEAAVALRGKNKVNFQRHLMPGTAVAIVNAGKLKLSLAKRQSTFRTRYTGYPGGLRQPSWEQLIAKKGIGEPLRLAVRGMLPRNRLRSKLMQNLTISE